MLCSVAAAFSGDPAVSGPGSGAGAPSASDRSSNPEKRSSGRGALHGYNKSHGASASVVTCRRLAVALDGAAV